MGLFFYSTGTLHRARLAVYCAPLLALFVYGGLTQHYSDGRVISYIVLGAQIGLADLAAAVEQPAIARLHGRGIVLAAGVIAMCVIAELANLSLRGDLPGTGSEPALYAGYRAAVTGLPADATIATPTAGGDEAAIPVYAGRLFATGRPLAFVHDQTERQQISTAFFSAQATSNYRRQVIARYHVRYIVVPNDPGNRPLIGQLTELGSVIRRGSMFDTIAVRQ